MSSKKSFWTVNWWRVFAAAGVILSCYSTWMYVETKARLNHILEHQVEHAAADRHGSRTGEAAVPPSP